MNRKMTIKRFWGMLIALSVIVLTASCGADGGSAPMAYDMEVISGEDTDTSKPEPESTETEESTPEETEALNEATEPEASEKAEETETAEEDIDGAEGGSEPAGQESIEFNGISYRIIQVDGGDLSGEREPNVAVDIGYGDRIYWAFTNEYGQLVHVVADQVTLQFDAELTEGNSRYYPDEAKVPGTEQPDLDEGHIIADSLGGVANAYNITPQNSMLNRHGDQAYMEKVIRDAGGCEDLVATITYPDTTTQIPSRYKYEYTLLGHKVTDEFDNVNPDEVNAVINAQPDIAGADAGGTEEAAPPVTESDAAIAAEPAPAAAEPAPAAEPENIANIDTNGNGQVTIAEAKAAGFTMPIHSDHWLYKYMHDGDGDGMVGE